MYACKHVGCLHASYERAHVRMYAYMHTHTCLHTYTQPRTHTCMHAYIHACTHTNMHAGMHMHTYIHTHMQTNRQTNRHTYIHIPSPVGCCLRLPAKRLETTCLDQSKGASNSLVRPTSAITRAGLPLAARVSQCLGDFSRPDCA